MVSLQAAVLALALTGTSGEETVLLDFYADWCGPCQQMNPTVEQLVARGYPVRKINFDQNRALAAQYGVEQLPSFVMLVGGRVADRVVGTASLSRLERMCQMARDRQEPERLPSPAAVPASGWRMASLKGRGAGGAPVASDAELIACTVRLRIEDADGHSCGSGTIIDARQGEALILTCGHLFRDSEGKGRIEVDLFGPTPASRLRGCLLTYDLEQDLALVTVRTPGPVAVARVAPEGYRVSPGDRVANVGCNNGELPTVRRSQVTSLDRYLGPPNLQVGGRPVLGRSGGGLFSADGSVIGVCNAADPSENEGLYAALGAIHSELHEARLSFVYQPGGQRDAGQAPLVAVTPPRMPERMPLESPAIQLTAATSALPGAGHSDAGHSDAGFGTGGQRLSDEERAALDEIRRRRSQGAEVICVIRSLGDPQAPSEVIVLDRVSEAFLQQLAGQAPNPGGPHLTSLEVSRDRSLPAVELRPMPR